MAKRWLRCNICTCTWQWSYWKWVWKAPFHWPIIMKKPLCIRDSRLTKCPYCGCKSWMIGKKDKR